MAQAASAWRIEAVLFDLDGTLIDSAPDLAGTLNDMRAARGLAPVTVQHLRPHVGAGARGMLGAGFDMTPGQPHYEAMRDEFHGLYEQRMLRLTQPFPAALQLLDALDRRGMRWGIVTNKALRFAAPMCRSLDLMPRAAALIGGDSTPHAKPHPALLLEAARQMGVEAARCVYVGDDLRDVQAARAAGMAALAASWGYHGAGVPIAQWGADALLAAPPALLQWLDLA